MRVFRCSRGSVSSQCSWPVGRSSGVQGRHVLLFDVSVCKPLRVPFLLAPTDPSIFLRRPIGKPDNPCQFVKSDWQASRHAIHKKTNKRLDNSNSFVRYAINRTNWFCSSPADTRHSLGHRTLCPPPCLDGSTLRDPTRGPIIRRQLLSHKDRVMANWFCSSPADTRHSLVSSHAVPVTLPR